VASNLRLITDAVANLTVSYTAEAGGTVTATAKDINQVPQSVPAADVPLRLMGYTEEGGNAGTMTFETAGAGVEYIHTVSELCLIESVGLSRGMDELPDQQRYYDAILTALASNRGIYTNSDITFAEAERTKVEYPLGSDQGWYAVVTTITVREIA